MEDVRYSKINSLESSKRIQKNFNLAVSDCSFHRRLMDNNSAARNPRKVSKTGSNTLKVCPKIYSFSERRMVKHTVDRKKRILFHMAALGLDSMFAVRPTPNMKLSIHKEQLTISLVLYKKNVCCN